MFERICPNCRITIFGTPEEIGFSFDEEAIATNERRRNYARTMVNDYNAKVEEYKNTFNKAKSSIKEGNKKIGFSGKEFSKIKVFTGDNLSFQTYDIKVELVNKKEVYFPSEEMITILPISYMECEICGHRVQIGSHKRVLPSLIDTGEKS